ncbi:MAG: zinc ribbon domain-containing protein, partial [Dehalococcoidia bacterium]|nr:zinc ribbon domain-containing protein [Dehalococcoidia bacterium]
VSEAVKSCMSCGMPMTKPEDFGGGNPENLYCVHCSKPDGSLKSYKEVFEGMVKFMMMSQKMDRKAAESAAKERMAKIPAWSGKA